MNYKRRYTRKELMVDSEKFTTTCALCRVTSGFRKVARHTKDCPLASKAVVAVVVQAQERPGVVFAFSRGRWWWKSYHIEKLPPCNGFPHGRYEMFDQSGNSIVERRTLSSIRHWIALNQGVLA